MSDISYLPFIDIGNYVKIDEEVFRVTDHMGLLFGLPIPGKDDDYMVLLVEDINGTSFLIDTFPISSGVPVLEVTDGPA